jgi:hypothetical protein
MQTIFLQIRDQIQTIQVKEIFNPIQPMVSVEFENGYQNIFFVDLETHQWVEQDLGFTRLAEILGGQLAYMIHFFKGPKKTFCWRKESLGEELMHFGFLKYKAAADMVYEIFASNRRYMFTLIRKKQKVWQIMKMPGTEGWDFNLNYLEAVPFLLDTLKL